VAALYFATLKSLEVQEEVLRNNYDSLGKYSPRKVLTEAEKAQQEEQHSRIREVKNRDQEKVPQPQQNQTKDVPPLVSTT